MKPMRNGIKIVAVLLGMLLALSGCGSDTSPEHEAKPVFHQSKIEPETPGVGEPCLFGYPSDPSVTGGFPACHPLQLQGGELSVNNQACPLDCLQMPSLQCQNLICTSTQVYGDPNHVNGQCWEVDDGQGGIEVRCMGYCTKECLDDDSCPAGYECRSMAPFGSVLACEQEELWGTQCTPSCVPQGESPPGSSITCPSSVPGDPDYGYANCGQSEYSKCCACLCWNFCPILEKKFCAKMTWDSVTFPHGTSEAVCD